jgi:hypothetical protein
MTPRVDCTWPYPSEHWRRSATFLRPEKYGGLCDGIGVRYRGFYRGSPFVAAGLPTLRTNTAATFAHGIAVAVCDGGQLGAVLSRSLLQPRLRLRLQPFCGVRMCLERTNMLNRAIRPFGLN